MSERLKRCPEHGAITCPDCGRIAASPEAPGLTTEQLRSCWRGDADGYPDFAAIALAVDALLASQPNARAVVMHEPKLYPAEGLITGHEGTYTVASIGCTCGWNSDGESYKKVGDWDAHLHAAPPSGQPATEAEERLLKSLEESEPKWRKDGLIATADPVEALTAEKIASLIEEHETSYINRSHPESETGWEWSCKCGEKGYSASWEFCTKLTRGHWANVIEAALRASRMAGGRLTRCGEPAGHLIAGASWFACVLAKGHEGEHQRGGNCFAHGEYIGNQCPKWPDCAALAASRQQPAEKTK